MLMVFTISMVIYIMTLAPTVTGEDSGELIASAYGLGVAHPSGYPLWAMLAAITIKIIPFCSIAWRANLLSALLSSLAVVVLCHILQRFFSLKPLIAGLGSLCFACGLYLWSQSVIAEVYTLHILLFCLVLHFTLTWLQTGRDKYLYVVSLLIGMALTNHHLAALLGPVLLIVVLVRKPGVFISPKVILLCLVFLAIGLLPYLYLPWASSSNPYINWGSPDTWDNFLHHVLRRQYGDESMNAPHSWQWFWGHIKTLWQWNLQQYTIISIPFIMIGIIYLACRKRTLFFFTLGLFLMHTIILAEILNFNFQRQELFCARVFFLPAYVITALWLTLGADWFGRRISLILPNERFRAYSRSIPLCILLIFILTNNFQKNNMRHYYYAHDHADNILNSIEAEAILIPSGDHNTFPVIYRHYVEGIRPDVTIADKYGYIEYDLYRDMPNASERTRTRRQREEIEAYLIKHSGRPVYYTVKPRLHLLPGYRAVSYGMLFRIYAPQEKLPVGKLPEYHYRNLTGTDSVQDHAATVILSDYYFHLAANALRRGKKEQALENMEKVADLSEGLKEEMNNLGTLMAEFKLDQQAIRFYEKAAQLDKNYLTPRWNLGHLFKAQGNLLHAIQVFNDLAEIDPDDYRVFGELGFLLYQYGQTDLALKNWGKSLSLNPEQTQVISAVSNVKLPK